ncbi:MAG: isoprenylcysteine carboxylmethyltransferase family protein [Burkholderiaceae bacterium]
MNTKTDVAGVLPAVSTNWSAMVSRALAITYSITCYFIGVAALVYLILFIADMAVPVSLTQASPIAPSLFGLEAVLWNVGVLALWGAQHTVMARPGFKRMWTRIVPPAVERSTYLIFVALATATLVFLWAPLPTVLWDTSGSLVGHVLLGVYFLGWAIVLFSTFLINHFQLFGLQQAYQSNTQVMSKKDVFVTPLLYKMVRHPMMTGVLIALWAVPTLTVSRLVFNIVMTSYVFIGLYFEEKTLVAELGDEYREYRKTTPSVIPGLRPDARR